MPCVPNGSLQRKSLQRPTPPGTSLFRSNPWHRVEPASWASSSQCRCWPPLSSEAGKRGPRQCRLGDLAAESDLPASDRALSGLDEVQGSEDVRGLSAAASSAS